MHELKTVTFDAEQIMEQAQVFASAWSLVGGCFDSGSMLAEAESMKAELRTMIEKTLAAAPTPAAQSALRDDQIRELVNQLRDTAIQFRDAKQLRARIAGIIVPVLKSAAQSAGQEAVAWAVYSGIGEMRKHSVHSEKAAAVEVASSIKSNTEVRPLYAAPVNGGEREVSGDTVADRLDAMADLCKPGSQAMSDLYAAATAWRKHLNPKRATDAPQVVVQPAHEQAARFAIDGAISYGMQGVNMPPDRDHWLAEYWEIGRKLAALSSPAKVGGDEFEFDYLGTSYTVYGSVDALRAFSSLYRRFMEVTAEASKVGGDELEAFESWARSKKLDMTPYCDSDDSFITYDSDFTSRAWDGWQARAALSADGGDRKDSVKALAKSVFSGTSSLRWLLNITTEFDRQDVRTRQAARLLDEFFDKAGVTNRAHLEHLWKCLHDVLGTDEVIEILNERDAAIAASTAKGDA